MWLAFFIVSIAALVGVGAIFIAINNSDFVKRHRFNLFNMLFLDVFVSAVIMFYPIHHISNLGISNVPRAIMLSVFNSIQIFAGGCEFNVIVEGMGLSGCPDWLFIPYQIWAAVLLILAPIFTFGFVLSLFKNLSASAKYRFSFFKDVYVFSELNEKSLALASDIRANHEKVAIVFTDVFDENKESSFELIEEAKKLKAICFKNDILVIKFWRHSVKKAISFFTIGENEAENLNQSLKLLEKYRNRKNTRLYVFSTSVESELLLSSADKGEIKVRRINEVQSLIYRQLYFNGNIIFDIQQDDAEKTKNISAVVVGMGRHGTEMVKALTWFGQMNGYKLEINAFDKDPLAKEKFEALAPELMSEKYNDREIEGEAYYKITVHPEIDVDSSSFVKEISSIKNATYVLVALGNDDDNISTAINLRMYFERIKAKPIIQAIVYNSQQKRALKGIKNFKGQDYRIDFIGDLESSYIEDVIIDSELEKEALERHLSYVKAKIDGKEFNREEIKAYLAECGVTEDELFALYDSVKSHPKKRLAEKETQLLEKTKPYILKRINEEQAFWNFEYNYRSSVASAIHMKARIDCGIPGAAKKTEELTTEERDIIEVLEHKRWNAYMRAEGYIYSLSTDPSSRNDLAKMHHNLVEYSVLDENDKRKDSQVGTK